MMLPIPTQLKRYCESIHHQFVKLSIFSCDCVHAETIISNSRKQRQSLDCCQRSLVLGASSSKPLLDTVLLISSHIGCILGLQFRVHFQWWDSLKARYLTQGQSDPVMGSSCRSIKKWIDLKTWSHNDLLTHGPWATICHRTIWATELAQLSF